MSARKSKRARQVAYSGGPFAPFRSIHSIANSMRAAYKRRVARGDTTFPLIPMEIGRIDGFRVIFSPELAAG